MRFTPEMKTDTKTLIAALREIPNTIHDEEGLVSATIMEAADRMEELEEASGAFITEGRAFWGTSSAGGRNGNH